MNRKRARYIEKLPRDINPYLCCQALDINGERCFNPADVEVTRYFDSELHDTNWGVLYLCNYCADESEKSEKTAEIMEKFRNLLTKL